MSIIQSSRKLQKGVRKRVSCKLWPTIIEYICIFDPKKVIMTCQKKVQIIAYYTVQK